VLTAAQSIPSQENKATNENETKTRENEARTHVLETRKHENEMRTHGQETRLHDYLTLLTPRVDIHMVGTLLLYCINRGEVNWSSGDELQGKNIDRLVGGRGRDLEDGVLERIKRVIQRCWMVDSEDGYNNAEEVVQGIRAEFGPFIDRIEQMRPSSKYFKEFSNPSQQFIDFTANMREFYTNIYFGKSKQAYEKLQQARNLLEHIDKDTDTYRSFIHNWEMMSWLNGEKSLTEMMDKVGNNDIYTVLMPPLNREQLKIMGKLVMESDDSRFISVLESTFRGLQREYLAPQELPKDLVLASEENIISMTVDEKGRSLLAFTKGVTLYGPSWETLSSIEIHNVRCASTCSFISTAALVGTKGGGVLLIRATKRHELEQPRTLFTHEGPVKIVELCPSSSAGMSFGRQSLLLPRLFGQSVGNLRPGHLQHRG